MLKLSSDMTGDNWHNH